MRRNTLVAPAPPAPEFVVGMYVAANDKKGNPHVGEIFEIEGNKLTLGRPHMAPLVTELSRVQHEITDQFELFQPKGKIEFTDETGEQTIRTIGSIDVATRSIMCELAKTDDGSAYELEFDSDKPSLIWKSRPKPKTETQETKEPEMKTETAAPAVEETAPAVQETTTAVAPPAEEVYGEVATFDGESNSDMYGEAAEEAGINHPFLGVGNCAGVCTERGVDMAEVFLFSGDETESIATPNGKKVGAKAGPVEIVPVAYYSYYQTMPKYDNDAGQYVDDIIRFKNQAEVKAYQIAELEEGETQKWKINDMMLILALVKSETFGTIDFNGGKYTLVKMTAKSWAVQSVGKLFKGARAKGEWATKIGTFSTELKANPKTSRNYVNQSYALNGATLSEADQQIALGLASQFQPVIASNL